MKITAPLLFALFATSSVVAAELPIAGTYGTPTGCALVNDTRPVPDGKPRAVATNRVLVDEATCPITEIGEGVTEGDVTTWQVSISCEAGHEEAQPGVISVAENTAKSEVVVSLLEGMGPKGTLRLCSPAQ